jgi:hypothetical protein
MKRGLDSIPTQTRRRGGRQPCAHQTSALMRSKISRLNVSLAQWDGVSSPSPPVMPRWAPLPPQPHRVQHRRWCTGYGSASSTYPTHPGTSRATCCQRCSAPHPRWSTTRGSRCRYGGWRNWCQGDPCAPAALPLSRSGPLACHIPSSVGLGSHRRRRETGLG